MTKCISQYLLHVVHYVLFGTCSSHRIIRNSFTTLSSHLSFRMISVLTTFSSPLSNFRMMFHFLQPMNRLSSSFSNRSYIYFTRYLSSPLFPSRQFILSLYLVFSLLLTLPLYPLPPLSSPLLFSFPPSPCLPLPFLHPLSLHSHSSFTSPSLSPACLHLRIASATSGRAGSLMPQKPYE